MNSILLLILLVPVIEIYVLIKIGSQIGAITTIFLIFTTAIFGLYYARYEGLNTLKSGFSQLSKQETPAYEVISGAAIAFAALLLIIPGFATDLLGFFLIFPITRKIILNKFSKKFSAKKKTKSRRFASLEVIASFTGNNLAKGVHPSIPLSSVLLFPCKFFHRCNLLSFMIFAN